MSNFFLQQAVWTRYALILTFSLTSCALGQTKNSIGIFEEHQDIGTILHPGSAHYDKAREAYIISASGETMWIDSDDFHFVWKKISGDVTLASDIELEGTTGPHNPHRKAMLIIRQSLEPDSPYVDISVHGVGKTSLQFREAPGAMTHTIASNIYAPRRVKLVKQGDYYYAFISGSGGKMQFTGSSTKLPLTGTFYVGLGVCSHEKDVVETAIFSKVKLTNTPTVDATKQQLYSTIETIGVGAPDRQVEYTTQGRLEAPNWSKDGLFFVFNMAGSLYRLPVKCGDEDTGCAGETIPLRVPTDPASKVNNDHGLSPNGKLIAISDQSQKERGSLIYTLPILGGTPNLITQKGPSYWHGWSPDGKTIAFTGQRDGSFGIFTTPLTGGEETRLTTAKGLDDGPDYSPDGKYIYFNSDRTGSMQIWRMHSDGSSQEQVVTDEYNDWFPHISPDGKWMVFLSYAKDVAGHPADKDVRLFTMSMKDGKVQELATLFGGQGTINVSSWSPDGKNLAFVSYKYVPVDSLGEK